MMLEQAKRQKMRRLKMLIIDDDPVALKLGQIWFGRLFCTVYSAYNSEQAELILARIKRQKKKLDIILLDLNLTHEFGENLAQNYRQRFKNTAICLWTAGIVENHPLLKEGFECIQKSGDERLTVPPIMYYWHLRNLEINQRSKLIEIDSQLPYRNFVTTQSRQEIRGAESLEVKIWRDAAFFYVMGMIYRHPAHPRRLDIGLPVGCGCLSQCISCLIAEVQECFMPLKHQEMISIFLHALNSYLAHGFLSDSDEININFTTGSDLIYNAAEVLQTIKLISAVRQLKTSFVITTIGRSEIFREYLPKLEQYPVKIYLSAGSFDQHKRSELFPGTGGQSLEDLAPYLMTYYQRTGQRTTLCWMLIRGFNDSTQDIADIVDFCKRWTFFDVKIMLMEKMTKKASLRFTERQVTEAEALFFTKQLSLKLKEAQLDSIAYFRINMGADLVDGRRNYVICGGHLTAHDVVKLHQLRGEDIIPFDKSKINPKLIIFDFDGVLIKKVAGVFPGHLLNGLLPNSYSAPEGSTFSFQGTNWIDDLQKIGVDVANRNSLEEISRRMLNYYKHQVQLFNWVAKALPRMARTMKLAILSNNSLETVKTALNGLESNFSSIQAWETVPTLNNVPILKPAPDGILKICYELRVRPSDTLMVGDSVEDMLAATKAGVHFVMLDGEQY